MPEIIQLDEKTRIRLLDPKNWTVELLKEVESRDGSKSMRWEQANGQKYGPFYMKPEHCITWLLDRRFAESPGTVTLGGAIDEYRSIAAELEAAFKEAMR